MSVLIGNNQEHGLAMSTTAAFIEGFAPRSAIVPQVVSICRDG
jgi:hypothetical protein